jgi:hypothetical protein
MTLNRRNLKIVAAFFLVLAAVNWLAGYFYFGHPGPREHEDADRIIQLQGSPTLEAQMQRNNLSQDIITCEAVRHAGRSRLNDWAFGALTAAFLTGLLLFITAPSKPAVSNPPFNPPFRQPVHPPADINPD